MDLNIAWHVFVCHSLWPWTTQEISHTNIIMKITTRKNSSSHSKATTRTLPYKAQHQMGTKCDESIGEMIQMQTKLWLCGKSFFFSNKTKQKVFSQTGSKHNGRVKLIIETVLRPKQIRYHGSAATIWTRYEEQTLTKGVKDDLKRRGGVKGTQVKHQSRTDNETQIFKRIWWDNKRHEANCREDKGLNKTAKIKRGNLQY